MLLGNLFKYLFLQAYDSRYSGHGNWLIVVAKKRYYVVMKKTVFAGAQAVSGANLLVCGDHHLASGAQHTVYVAYYT